MQYDVHWQQAVSAAAKGLWSSLLCRQRLELWSGLSVFTGNHLTQKARLGNSAVRIKDGSSNFLFWGI